MTHSIPTYAPFPIHRAQCPTCGGMVELVASIPKDNKSFYTMACYQCPASWKSSEEYTEAIQNFNSNIKAE